MVCPFAVRRGLLIWCKAIEKFVNPLVRPCMTGNYSQCPEYRKAITSKASEASIQASANLSFRDEYSSRLLDPIFLAALVSNSQPVDSATGRPVELLKWAVQRLRESRLRKARVEITCSSEGWRSIAVIEDGVYKAVYVETKDGDKLVGINAWNLVRGSECSRAVAVLYRLE